MSLPKSLSEHLKESLVAAMKAKDELRTSTLRMVKAAFKNAEIDKRSALSETEMVAILQKLKKQRFDSIEQFTKANRHDLADKEKLEVVIIEEFLPKAMSESELVVLIDQVAATMTGLTMKDMGKLIKAVMEKAAGRGDGKVVSELVKKKLS